MVSLQIQIFVLLGIGFVLAKRGLFSKSTQNQLTNIVFLVVLPAAIVKSFQIDLDASLMFNCVLIMLISLAIQFLYFIANKLLYNRFDEDERICAQYSTMVSNAGFMGMPIAYGLFGDQALLYASFFLVPVRVFMWSSGISLFAKASYGKIWRQVLIHPCMIAVYVGFAVMGLKYFGIELPGPISDTIGVIAKSNTTICLLVIGGILGDLEQINFFNLNTLIFSFYRLIALPLVVMAGVRLFHVDSLIGNICILLSAMPAGSTTAMMAQRYEGNVNFASQLVFVSTLLSLGTLPLITFIFNSF
ncbi:MAG: AEC family transporter [Erysipelotrichaceae bacterium]|nr:AEC family transporter [Erysipelotrichaceae bacterium]